MHGRLQYLLRFAILSIAVSAPARAQTGPDLAVPVDPPPTARVPSSPAVGFGYVSAHAGGFLAVDRVGAGLTGDLSAQVNLSDDVALTAEVSPAYLDAGERINGWRGGLGSTLGLRVAVSRTTWVEGFAGAVTLAFAGTPAAFWAGLRARVRLFEWLEEEARISIGWNSVTQGILLNATLDLRCSLDPIVQPFVHLLLPMSSINTNQVGLGVFVLEAGTRIYVSDDVSVPRVALDVAIGATALQFQPQCDFGPCASAEWIGGPSVSVGLRYEYQ